MPLTWPSDEPHPLDRRRVSSVARSRRSIGEGQNQRSASLACACRPRAANDQSQPASSGDASVLPLRPVAISRDGTNARLAAKPRRGRTLGGCLRSRLRAEVEGFCSQVVVRDRSRIGGYFEILVTDGCGQKRQPQPEWTFETASLRRPMISALPVAPSPWGDTRPVIRPTHHNARIGDPWSTLGSSPTAMGPPMRLR